MARHWLVGVVNASLTAVLGLGLIRASEKIGLIPPLLAYRIRRLVALVSLFKGALYLILGDSMTAARTHFIAWGVQAPDPLDISYLDLRSSTSILHPTAITQWVSIILLGLAFGLLVRRFRQMISSQRALDVFLQLEGKHHQAAEKGIKAHEALARAAVACDFPKHRLPEIVVAAVTHPTPLVLGFFRPRLLVSFEVLATLSDQEIEMALRHELAHIRRGDQLWRWIQSWLEDIGYLNPLTGWLSQAALLAEEQCCDGMALRHPGDGAVLAHAIVKVREIFYHQSKNSASISGLGLAWNSETGFSPPDVVVPLLLGRYSRLWRQPSLINLRLQSLLFLSMSIKTLDEAIEPEWVFSRFGRFLARFFLFLLLFVALYVKFHFTPDIR